MKMLIGHCLFLLLVFKGSPLQAATPNQNSGAIIIKMQPGQSLPLIKNVKNVQNLFENTYVLRTDNIASVEATLKGNPAVVYMERSHQADKTPLPTPHASEGTVKKRETNSQFNDPQVGRIWAFDDAEYFGVSVNAAYKTYGTTNTSEVIVAVVDTGVDIRHEDLAEAIWVNRAEIPGNGIDDDNNGYIDDINGINTLVRDRNGKATVNITDTHSHGTHVSGTIGARQNNKIGIAGIASNVRIMGIRTVPNDGDETDVDVAEAFVYAARNGAKIINCSFGKSTNEGGKLIPDTLKYIGEKYGVLVIAAAGNDSDDIDKHPTYPASLPNDNLLIIASTTSSGRMSGFSNYGAINVDVAAPGSNIFSTTPGNRYESMSGTSMATPTTVGVAAEILSHNPNIGHLALKSVLINSVSKVAGLKGKMISGGRIDLLKGLELAKSIK